MYFSREFYNWKYIIPMSFFTAWLWSYPLFGHLQVLFLYNESIFFHWNHLFLSGLSIGFFSHAFKFSKVFFKIHISIIVFTGAGIMLLSSRFSPESSQFSYYTILFSSFLLGIISSIYMTRWSSNLVLLKKNQIGSTMGMMMLLASLFYSINLIIGENFISLYTSLAFLILSSFYSQKSFGKIFFKIKDINSSLKLRFVKFWLPFIFILASFYTFSSILMNYIFPSVRVESLLMYVIGSVIYGLAAFLGGIYLDKFKKIENIVLLGIVFLGVFYFLSPVVNFLPFINIGLEFSYALIDLFIWVGIAYASIKFNYNPVRCFGFGLGMNILFILLGFLVNNFISTGTGSYDFYSIALIVGMMMLISIFPALSMKDINILKDKPTSPYKRVSKVPENLTPREKQVFKLLMTKMSNEEIQNNLSISKNTLKTHIRNIYAKSGVKSRYELVVKHKSERSDNKR